MMLRQAVFFAGGRAHVRHSALVRDGQCLYNPGYRSFDQFFFGCDAPQKGEITEFGEVWSP
jgi:hypothetical protein